MKKGKRPGVGRCLGELEAASREMWSFVYIPDVCAIHPTNTQPVRELLSFRTCCDMATLLLLGGRSSHLSGGHSHLSEVIVGTADKPFHDPF